MIKCVIIDDEPLAIKLLSSYVEKLDGLELAETFSNPLEGLMWLQKNTPDLLLLDVQMPELSGVQLARLLPPEVSVIFTTAYPEYAVEGFELRALDYLVKPVSFHRFIQAVDRVKEVSPAPVQIVSDSAEFLMVKTEYRHQKVNYADIQYFKGLGDYVVIMLREGKVLTLENMKSFEERLPSHRFVRVHKSYLVAVDQIDFVEKNRIGIGEELIPIGQTYQKAFWEVMEGR